MLIVHYSVEGIIVTGGNSEGMLFEEVKEIYSSGVGVEILPIIYKYVQLKQ